MLQRNATVIIMSVKFEIDLKMYIEIRTFVVHMKIRMYHKNKNLNRRMAWLVDIMGN